MLCHTNLILWLLTLTGALGSHQSVEPYTSDSCDKIYILAYFCTEKKNSGFLFLILDHWLLELFELQKKNLPLRNVTTKIWKSRKVSRGQCLSLQMNAPPYTASGFFSCILILVNMPNNRGELWRTIWLIIEGCHYCAKLSDSEETGRSAQLELKKGIYAINVSIPSAS